jgi:hypothetical protein
MIGGTVMEVVEVEMAADRSFSTRTKVRTVSPVSLLT